MLYFINNIIYNIIYSFWYNRYTYVRSRMNTEYPLLSLTEIARRVSQCSPSQQAKLAAILKHNDTTICPTNDYVLINLSAAPEKAIRLASEYLQKLPPDVPEIPIDDSTAATTITTETYRRPGIQKRIAGITK